MVAAANNALVALPPVGDNPVPGAALGGGNGGGHGGAGVGHWNNNYMAARRETWSKFTSNTMEMKGHIFQPRNVSKNAN